jgi:hypothetical protein
MISVELTLREIWNIATGSVSSRMRELRDPQAGITGIHPPDDGAGVDELVSFRADE